MRTLLMAAALGFAGAAHADVALRMDEAGLVWAKPPSVADMAKWYPPGAGAKGVSHGSATLDCTARANGTLACSVLEQWPEPWKFGRSAMTVMRKAKVKTADGGSPEGKRFVYTFKFGRWPAALVTRPPAPGLEWRIQPALNVQSTAELPDGKAEAKAECVTRALGALDCTLVENTGDESFGAAVLRGLSLSRVQATDDQPVDGRTFEYAARYRRAD